MEKDPVSVCGEGSCLRLWQKVAVGVSVPSDLAAMDSSSALPYTSLTKLVLALDVALCISNGENPQAPFDFENSNNSGPCQLIDLNNGRETLNEELDLLDNRFGFGLSSLNDSTTRSARSSTTAAWVNRLALPRSVPERSAGTARIHHSPSQARVSGASPFLVVGNAVCADPLEEGLKLTKHETR
jgi:hypothetical protein